MLLLKWPLLLPGKLITYRENQYLAVVALLMASRQFALFFVTVVKW